MASWSNAFALELNYPTLTFPGGPFSITNATSLAQYIKYFFIFFIVAVGIVAAISIAYYGAKILFYSAGGNPEVIDEARKNIFGMVLGIVLLFFAFILLNTINPELVTFQDIGFPSRVSGMYYTFNAGGQTFSTPAPDQESDMGNIIGSTSDQQFWSAYNDATALTRTPLYLTYYCTTPNKNALVWLYDRTNFKINPNTNAQADNEFLPDTNFYGIVGEAANERMIKLTCGSNAIFNGQAQNTGNTIMLSADNPANTNTDVLSWIWRYEQTGAYFYFTKNCTGIPSFVQTEPANNNIRPFNGSDVDMQAARVQSVRITNGSNIREVYGVYPINGNSCADQAIINSGQPIAGDLAGLPAGQTLTEIVNTSCYTIPQTKTPNGFVPFDPSSAYIFHYRKNSDVPPGVAIKLSTNEKITSLFANSIKNNFNAPALSDAFLYWEYRDNPDKLTEDGTITTTYGVAPFCAVTDTSTCIKSLQFNLRKSYTVFLRGKYTNNAAGQNNGNICIAYTTDTFLPFSDVEGLNRYIYRMDIIPTYQKSGL